MLSKETIATSAKFFIPIFIILILGGFYTYQGEKKREVDKLYAEEHFTISQSEHIIQQDLKALQEQISILSHAPDTIDAVNQFNSKSVAKAAKFFFEVAKSKKAFNQIRLIDTSGQEHIRVNQTKSGPVIVPSNSLQNKSKRYYFQQAIKLNGHQTYYSRIDLNVENGKIEVPYRPMLRVAKTVIDTKGEKRGIVIINYSAQSIINNFISFFAHTAVKSGMLLDGKGYWIKDTNPSNEWGFMFGKKRTFATIHPNLWSKMKRNSEGQFKAPEGLLTYTKMSINSGQDTSNPLNTIYLVSLVPPSKIKNLSSPVFFKIWGSVFILTIISIFGSSQIAKHQLRAEKSRRKLALNSQKDHLLNAMIEGVIGLDSNGNCIFANQSALHLMGYSEKQLTANHFQDLVVVKKDSVQGKNNLQDNLISNLLTNGAELESEALLLKRDGSLLPTHLMGRQMYDETNNLTGAVISFLDLSNEFEAKEKIHQLSNYDRITNLPNHKLTTELINEQLDALSKDDSAILITIDIDRFSNINSSLGFEAGNIILSELAKRLKNYFMTNAVVGRIGPDEFAIYIPESDSYNRLKYIELLTDLISFPIHFLETDYTINCSIGACVLSNDTQNALHAIQNAELAMTRAKKASGDNIQFYSSGLRTASLRATKLEQNLRHAIDNDELQLYYQPQIIVDSGRLKGAEALIRWNRSEQGLITPDEFIPLAEETGFIKTIDKWVLKEAIKQRGEWYEKFPNKDFTISINISSAMFTSPDLIETIYQFLNTYNVNPLHINIELTETSMLGDIDLAIDTIKCLKAINIGISVDDFGTGYSSLSYLKNLPIDVLKIDKSFIDHMLENKKDAAVVEAIMSIAKGMDLVTVAEGIENEKQLTHISQLGCQIIQGYYFSRPLDATSFESWLT